MSEEEKQKTLKKGVFRGYISVSIQKRSSKRGNVQAGEGGPMMQML